jgi:hypothetical protein
MDDPANQSSVDYRERLYDAEVTADFTVQNVAFRIFSFPHTGEELAVLTQYKSKTFPFSN